MVTKVQREVKPSRILYSSQPCISFNHLQLCLGMVLEGCELWWMGQGDPNPKALIGEAASPMFLNINTTLTYCCAAFKPHQFLPLAQAVLPSPCQTSTDVLTPTGAQIITNRIERLVRAVFLSLPEFSAVLKRGTSHFLTLLSKTFLWATLLILILLGEHREAPTRTRIALCPLM